MTARNGNYTNIEVLHDCEQCHGRIVLIELDKMGVTRCGYCHEIVDYSPLYIEVAEKRIKEVTK